MEKTSLDLSLAPYCTVILDNSAGS